MSCYIFYTHNTFAQYHVNMALESLVNQDTDFSFDELVVYNNSTDLETEFILDSFDRHGLTRRFTSIRTIKNYPKTTKVCEDLENQKNIIKGHDWYICHKSDFYLPNKFIGNLLRSRVVENASPYYLNFCKFDTRETAKTEDIRHMGSQDSFTDMLEQPYTSFSDAHKYAPGINLNHLAIGYRGNRGKTTFDGVMHCYNEKARELLTFNSYWSEKDIFDLRERGIEMEIDKDLLFVIHMFHDIGRTDRMKSVPGYRF